jgi:hypothetical protein
MTTNYTKIPGRQRRVLDTAVALPVLQFFVTNPDEEASYEDLRLKFEAPSTGAKWVAGRAPVHRLMKLGLLAQCGTVPGAGRNGRAAMVYCAGPELAAWADTDHGRESLDMLERWRNGDTRRRLPKPKAQGAAVAVAAGQRVEVVGVEL